MQLDKSGALWHHLPSLLNQSSHWLFCNNMWFWVRDLLAQSSVSSSVQPLGISPDREAAFQAWLVFLILRGEFSVNNYNIEFSCVTDVILFLIFLQVILRMITAHFSLIILKKRDETIFSAWIIAKSTWQSKLLNSETAGDPRVSVIFL